jgi:endonuclease/exonuclease/phosphatase (EEP) superfamily protein YafD
MICQLVVIFAMGLSFTSKDYWWADLFSHFYFQYFWASCLTFIFAILIRYKGMTFMAMASMAVAYTIMMHSLWLYPSELPIRPQIPDAAKLVRIAHVNALILNDNEKSIDALLASQAPDIINIQEAGFKLFEHVSKDLKAQYPYQLHDPRSDSYGTIFLSKLPITGGENIPIKGIKYTSKIYRIELQWPTGRKFDIYSLHGYQPLHGAEATDHRNIELIQLGSLLLNNKNPAIMVGDLNITPYSPVFRNHLIRRSGYQFLGQGEWPVTPTWPQFLRFKPFQIQIDHMLYDPEAFAVKGWKTAPYEGSDHKALIADIVLIKK